MIEHVKNQGFWQQPMTIGSYGYNTHHHDIHKIVLLIKGHWIIYEAKTYRPRVDSKYRQIKYF